MPCPKVFMEMSLSGVKLLPPTGPPVDKDVGMDPGDRPIPEERLLPVL